MGIARRKFGTSGCGIGAEGDIDRKYDHTGGTGDKECGARWSWIPQCDSSDLPLSYHRLENTFDQGGLCPNQSRKAEHDAPQESNLEAAVFLYCCLEVGHVDRLIHSTDNKGFEGWGGGVLWLRYM